MRTDADMEQPTWNMVGQIAVLAFILLVIVDLLLRYLNSDGRGLIPWQTILRPFFLWDDKTTFQSVDEKYRKKG